jgi:thiol-disulfide isomerase/thioredoxin
MTTTDTNQDHESEPEDIGKPAPVLVIFLVIPLLGILVALLMVASELRTQRETVLPQVEGNPASLVNYAAPDFRLSTLDGQSVSLETYRGKTLYLNFWQTTCVPCITEMPEFLDFLANQNPDEVALLAVNVNETPGMIREFFATNDILGIPTALDGDASVQQQYGVIGYPTTFIIDEAGVVRYLRIGGMTYDNMAEYLKLAQTKDPAVER